MAKKLPLDELSGAIGRIRRLLLTEEKVDAAVEPLARAIKDSIPGSIGAGVSLLDVQGRRTSYGATDRVVEQADALQYDLGEGPCLTAWASEECILVDDVRTDDRWPRWSAAVQSLPIRSVVSTPLVADGETLGALKVYAALPAAFTPATTRLLELLPRRRPRCSGTFKAVRCRCGSAKTSRPPWKRGTWSTVPAGS